MPATCDTCKKTVDGSDLRELTGLDAHSRGLGEGVRLCEDCLTRRRTRQWQRSDPDHDDLVEALRERSEPKDGRYAFLEGDEDVHLVRLRHDWVERVHGS